jgi:hypothetical protein
VEYTERIDATDTLRGCETVTIASLTAYA